MFVRNLFPPTGQLRESLLRRLFSLNLQQFSRLEQVLRQPAENSAPPQIPDTEPETLMSQCPLRSVVDFKRFEKIFKSKAKRNQLVSNRHLGVLPRPMTSKSVYFLDSSNNFTRSPAAKKI